MNDIKKGYPFVDLLKPELEGVIPVLLAVAPDKRDQIGGAFPVLKRLAMDKIRRATGLLGAEDEREDLSLTANGLPSQRRLIDHNALMALTDERLLRGVEPISLIADIERTQQLGIPEAVWSLVRGGDAREALRKALDKLQKDRSFDWSLEDDTFSSTRRYRRIECRFRPGRAYPFRRALRRRKRNGFYFNTGTWARLIWLAPYMLADQTEFTRVYGALAAGTMDALDKFPDLVLRRRTVVAVTAGSVGTRGELLHWDMANGKLHLIPIDRDAGMTKT